MLIFFLFVLMLYYTFITPIVEPKSSIILVYEKTTVTPSQNNPTRKNCSIKLRLILDRPQLTVIPRNPGKNVQ